MTIEPGHLILAVALYLGCLFAVAWVAKNDWLPARLINNPLVYVLSLGVSINTWSFYTAVGTASIRGYGYLAYYMGYAAAFLFATVLLQPILQITKTYQLSSMADLFSFRFRSPMAGTLTTLVLLVCIFPLLALQILAVAESANMLLPEVNTRLLAFLFCVVVLLFTLVFGASDQGGRDKHRGVVMAVAFETVVKLLALSALGLFAVYGVFGGLEPLDRWLAQAPPETTRLETPFFESATNLVMLLFFTAAIAMPHMFHMTFKENSNPAYLKYAGWGLPLLLLLAALPVLPVLWASSYLELQAPVDYSALALGLLQQSPGLTLLVFVGGMGAAFGIMVVIAMALSNMCLNHLILPLRRPDAQCNLYDWLLLRRRLLIGAIILGCFLCFLPLADSNQVVDTGYVAFIACVQLLPGIITLLYWPAGNRKGFVSGLCAGLAVWLILGLLPLFTGLALFDTSYLEDGSGELNWELVTIFSLLANLLTLVLTSLFSTTSEEERTAGKMCALETFQRPRRLEVNAKTPLEFIEPLSRPLGEVTARREVMRAMKDLGLREGETRSYPLQQLRDQLEANLSGLLGPTMANQIIDRCLPFELVSAHASRPLDVSFIESRLEAYPANLTGVAEDLDKLRRHHRQMLRDLPLGVCSIGLHDEITLWNGALERLTGIPAGLMAGSPLDALPEPWQSLLRNFIADTASTHIHKKSLMVNERHYWVSLHKATIEMSRQESPSNEGLVIVIEDLTETSLLEAELAHSERLASIGRLAAGVAHEIGNPITGIACLAQNIRDETTEEELRDMAEQIITQTNRAARIVQSLVSFSHNGSAGGKSGLGARHSVDIHACVDEAIQLLSLNRKHRDIRFNNHCNPGVTLHTDRQRLQQIFVNLLSNARDASATDACISVTDSIKDDQVSIIITDQGKGIPREVQDRIFEPFFTTKEPGKGTGLGLALVYSITEDLGGSIQVESPVDNVSKKGTRVIVTFPCYHDKALQHVETA